MEDLLEELPSDLDLVFFGAFSQSAQLAYALSNYFRRTGAVTVLGGPHARCYPEDARKYYDYVLGFTDREVIADVCRECAPHRPLGRLVTAAQQPHDLATLEERWKFVAPTLAKAPSFFKIVPLLGSLGCPYTCSFCIDSTVEYQPLSFTQLQSDLKFLLTKIERPIVAWHDPNFGVRFDDYMQAIEAAVPEGRIRHIAESSLSLLSEKHLQRLRKNGFRAILPGIESWYDLGNEAQDPPDRHGQGEADLGARESDSSLHPLHSDQLRAGSRRRFRARAVRADQGVHRSFSRRVSGILAALRLGRAAPSNLDYQRAGRVVPFPFHFLNNNHAMNVRPKNYSWTEFYDHLIDITRYSFSWRAILRRIPATATAIPKWMNVVRAVSSEGFGRIRYHQTIRRLLDTDRSVRDFLEGETDQLPEFYHQRIRHELGDAYQFLPDGALSHDPNAYLKTMTEPALGATVQLSRPAVN